MHSPAVRYAVSIPTVLLGALLLLPAPPAAAEPCPTEWREPVVCDVTLSVALEGNRRATAVDGPYLELPTRSRVDLYTDPHDQWGRDFPLRRFELRIEPLGRSDCDEVLTIQRSSDEGRFLLETGGRSGTCELLLWVPGNMNLDRELRIEVSRERAGGYTRAEAELLARWLFQGLLGRDPDDADIRSTAAEIQAGRLSSRMEGMVRSTEFRQRRAGLPPQELLNDLYVGLLGRKPDTSGVRSYLDDIERGNLARVATEILQSEELDARLAREVP